MGKPAAAAYAAAMRAQALVLSLLSLPALLAQQAPAPRRLQAVLAAFDAARAALYEGDKIPDRAAERDLLSRQLDELAAFLQHEASGDEVFETRLVLAERCLQLRERARAESVLVPMTEPACPPLLQLAAAEMAEALGKGELRAQLIDSALAKKTPLRTRLDVAAVLMSRLREPARGERIFEEAKEEAKGDDELAFVRWRQCAAIREREDLPENSYYEALDQLAKDLPQTRWGSIAKDRCLASEFALGGKGLDLRAKATDGSTVDTGAARGRAVLLAFCSLLDEDGRKTAAALAQKAAAHASDLTVALVAVDADVEAVRAAQRQLGLPFPVICDGEGLESEPMLRLHVETTPTVIALDREGRITGLNLHLATADARADFEAALKAALRQNG